jgi:CheY-like chemotaxis protein
MSGRILIVEDEFLIRLTLAEALRDEGYEVLEAESGEAALAALEQGEVMVLLTDLQLGGGMNGRMLAETARARSPDLPVIYMSGRPDELSWAGMSPRDRVLAKPYLPSDVVGTIRALLGGD